MRLAGIALALGVVGCSGDKVEDTAPTSTDPMDAFLDVTEEVSGSIECYTPGDDWLSQTVNPAAQTTATLPGDVEDFEDGCCLEDISVDVWLSDDVTGTPDLSAVSGGEGTVSLDLPLCAPMAYRTSTDPSLDQTKDTYEAHQVLGPSDVMTAYNSVSTTTYDVVAAVLGVSIDSDRSIIAGTAYGCDGEPLQKAQVVVVDNAGELADGLVVHYMQDEFPSRDQPYTSPDGLWVALNVPAGDWTVQLWGVVGGELQQLGATQLTAYADSINISNIYTGFGDGVRYPDECL
jgi:hypothetical protein